MRRFRRILDGIHVDMAPDEYASSIINPNVNGYNPTTASRYVLTGVKLPTGPGTWTASWFNPYTALVGECSVAEALQFIADGAVNEFETIEDIPVPVPPAQNPTQSASVSLGNVGGSFANYNHVTINWNASASTNTAEVYQSLDPKTGKKTYRRREGKIHHFETGEELSKDDALLTSFGYVNKNDPRIIDDYITKNKIIYDPAKYPSSYISVATEVDDKGNLIGDKYTTTVPEHSGYSCGITVYGKYFEPLLVLDENFKKFYEENLQDGYFALKSSKSFKPFVKGKKTLYRKTNCPTNSFKASVQDKPITYRGTFGKRYSFGLEIETCSGWIPSYLDSFIFYSAVHDGSLRHEDDGKVYGGEYVTDVLEGDLGLNNAKLLCNELTKRCLVDKTCGVHVHLGNVQFSRENVVLMYYLYYMIQNEVFEMLPKSRRANQYCRKLDNLDIQISNILKDREYWIDYYYNRIVGLLSQKSGGASKEVNKKKDHPKGFKCGYDHSIARYCWVNFVPAVFNTRKNGVYTIEFRPAPASTSYTKIKNWLLICMSLVDVVENHKQYIYSSSQPSLCEILDICFPGANGKMLIEWVLKRKMKFEAPKSNLENVAVENQEYSENEIDEDMSLKKV